MYEQKKKLLSVQPLPRRSSRCGIRDFLQLEEYLLLLLLLGVSSSIPFPFQVGRLAAGHRAAFGFFFFTRYRSSWEMRARLNTGALHDFVHLFLPPLFQFFSSIRSGNIFISLSRNGRRCEIGPFSNNLDKNGRKNLVYNRSRLSREILDYEARAPVPRERNKRIRLGGGDVG